MKKGRNKKIPKSLRKFLRRKKAIIRKETIDIKEQEEKINNLYQEILNKNF